MVKRNKKIFVGMSGGVDSSVAAYLLKKAGYNVTGVFLNSYNVDGCALEDASMARRAAAHLKIPFYVLDVENEYRNKVVDYMIDGYRKGETPNPDVMCNREIKFGVFLKHALALGADFIATGHYTYTYNNNFYEAKDESKDQSYFLWGIDKLARDKIIFPLGEMLKSEVRVMAKKIGLPNAKKKDSQGICFLGKVKLEDFLSEYIPRKIGEIQDTNGVINCSI